MSAYQGDYDTTETVNLPFNTFSSDDPSASVTVTNLAAADIEIHKDGSVTQRASDAGVTVSIDFDGVTGQHMVHIDLSDNTDAGFYAAGSRYQVRLEGITVDAATLNVWIGSFSIGCVLRPATDGRTLKVDGDGLADANMVKVGPTGSGTAQTANDNGADINAILVDTAVIGALGAGLTAVPWNSAWDAEVQSECADALTAFAPPTKAEMDTAHGLLATEAKQDVIDGIVDDILVDTAVIGALGAGLTAVPYNAAWDVDIQSECADALAAIHLDHLLAADYDPAAKPGVATALLNELVENDAGVSRYTTNALEQAKGTNNGPTKTEMDTAHGLLATEAKQDIIDTNVDQIETAVITNAAGTDVAADIIALKAVADGIPTTAMRGTDSAATEAKQDIIDTNVDQLETAIITNAAGVDVAADIIAVKAVVDGIPTTAMRGTDSGATEAKQDIIDTVVDAIKVQTDALPESIPRNDTFTVAFSMVDATDGYTLETGLTVTGTRSIDGGAFASVTGAIAEIAASSGIYYLTGAAADSNGTEVVFKFASAGARTKVLVIRTAA